MDSLKHKIPNWLTFARILLIPFLIIAFFFEDGFKIYSVSIFLLAGITDWLDGYLSRKWEVGSKLGALMDPIADKLVVVSALALIIDSDASREGLNIELIPAIGIMCREIFISGLREFLAQTQVEMPVTNLAKWKTGIQITAISILLLAASDEIHIIVYYLGGFALWIAFLLTFYTGYQYFKAAKQQNLI